MTIMNIKVHISSTTGGATGAYTKDSAAHSFSRPGSPVHHIHRVKLTTSSVDDQSGLDSGFSDGSSPTASLSFEPFHYYYHLLCDPSAPNEGPLAKCSNFSPEVTVSSSKTTTSDDYSNVSNNSDAVLFTNSNNYKTSQKLKHLETFPKSFSDIFVDTSDYKGVFNRSSKENKHKKKTCYPKDHVKMCNHNCDNINDFSKLCFLFKKIELKNTFSLLNVVILKAHFQVSNCFSKMIIILLIF